MAASEVKQGDKVSWNWGGGAPAGTVAETKDEGEIAIQSKRGNTIKKNASPDDPAVHVERSGNDVVKRASELTVQEKAPMNKLDDGGERHDGKKRKPEEKEGKGNNPKQANTSKKPAHTEKARTGQSPGESELPCTSEADVKDDPKLGMEEDDVSTRTRSHDIET